MTLNTNNNTHNSKIAPDTETVPPVSIGAATFRYLSQFN
jgi:hypothetical protein